MKTDDEVIVSNSQTKASALQGVTNGDRGPPIRIAVVASKPISIAFLRVDSFESAAEARQKGDVDCFVSFDELMRITNGIMAEYLLN